VCGYWRELTDEPVSDQHDAHHDQHDAHHDQHDTGSDEHHPHHDQHDTGSDEHHPHDRAHADVASIRPRLDTFAAGSDEAVGRRGYR
jgi:zinc transport system substrate-binding protein